MVSLIWFFLIFSLVVISHEFGHFLVAKVNGIHVVEFFIGMGPTIFSFKKGGTKYSWKLFPLGGACVFEGMDGMVEADASTDKADQGEAVFEEDEANNEAESTPVIFQSSDREKIEETASEASDKESDSKDGSFLKASVWARFATIFAGPFFNVILGFILAFILVNMILIREPIVTEVMEDSAAQEAGLEAGDRIISLNGKRIYLYDELSLYTYTHEGQDLIMVIQRDDQLKTIALKPRYHEEEGRYLIGILNAEFIQDPKGLDSLRYAWYEVRYNFKMTGESLRMLFGGKVKSQDVAGPVGIAVNVVGETYENTKEYGFTNVLVNMLNIALMLTINLGILNLLPIPALDGGRLLFILIEIVRGKPVPPEKEALVHFCGMVFFLILVVLVFFNDLKNIFM